MTNRISRLLNAGGWSGFLRTLLMLATAVGLAIAEFVIFRKMYCGVFTIILTLLGWFFRKSIRDLGANYSRHSRRFLFVYGLFLVIANYAGLGHHIQLVIIAFACMVMFNLNFWSMTEAALVDQQLS